MTKSDKEKMHERVVKLYHGKEPTNHMQNFFDCVKSRQKPAADISIGHRSATVCHMMERNSTRMISPS